MIEINQLSSREAMGLPIHYQSSVLESFEGHLETFRNLSCEELIHILSSYTASLPERWAAGSLLALLGDPRINPRNPLMINIPATSIMIGCTLEEIHAAYDRYQHLGIKKEWLLKEYPKHKITISEFRIAKYPVTNYEYLLFLKETGHVDIPTSWRLGIYDASKSNHPVYGILPESCDDYANWLSKKTMRKFSIPTEYQWEYAAAGVNGNEFPWGENFSNECVNTIESGIYTTTPVGMFPLGVSPFGCMDMAGNVEEFVSNNYFVYPDGVLVEDDLGKIYRVARGGSFARHSDLARCKRRHGYYKKEVYAMGFRLVEKI
ncbi:MAG: formylglycine-generating enzyme family protein [Gammaproteobacteria bacterium]